VFFKDGTSTERVQVDFPIGHRERRAEGMPVLVKKFEAAVEAHFSLPQAQRVKALLQRSDFAELPVDEFVAELVTENQIA
jgi:2-methylcitrate dehydratase